ncbi:MAG: endonuclease/exonuclease/phosphatase family protein [Flammeovirgaceae bacterium]
MKKNVLLALLMIVLIGGTQAQQKHEVLGIVGFYNVENLFDTEDDPEKRDEDFLPDGRNKWTAERYEKKLHNLAKVISSIGGGPDILGLCEVENRKVVQDLAMRPELKNKAYQVVHFDAPDRRGIDCALLYNPRVFVPFATQTVKFEDPEDEDFLTRDILYVKGLFQKRDTLHILVNHWPSRRGGKEDKRIMAGQLARSVVDSIQGVNADAKIILMGDFNDDPTNKSIKNELRASNKLKKMEKGDLYNTGMKFFKQGYGSLKYRGVFNLFDQLIISQSLLKQNTKDVFYVTGSFKVFSPEWMHVKDGQWAGYPFRTYAGGAYKGGYSDHFPVYLFIGGTK